MAHSTGAAQAQARRGAGPVDSAAARAVESASERGATAAAMRFLVRFMGLLALAGAFAAAVIDGARWVVDGTFADLDRGGDLLDFPESAGDRPDLCRKPPRPLGVERRPGAGAAGARLPGADACISALLLLPVPPAAAGDRPLEPGPVTEPGAGRPGEAGSSAVGQTGVRKSRTRRSPGTLSPGAVDAPRRRSQRRPPPETTAGVRSSPGILLCRQAPGAAPGAEHRARPLKICFY